MKVSIPKDFGNTSKNPILPLVPEQVKSIKKEDLTAVNLCSDPGDHNSTQVKFSFKGLIGDHEMPRKILEWRRNVDRALIGLNLTTGAIQHNMVKQFMQGSTLSSFISAAGVILVNKKSDAIVHAEQARGNYPAATHAAHITADFAALRAAAETTTNNCDPLDHLNEAYGPEVVKDSLNKVVKNLLPNKTLQGVKQHLRREARKPLDMSVKQCIMHIYRINTEEIAGCPPVHNNTQCLTSDEIIDILLFGTIKSCRYGAHVLLQDKKYTKTIAHNL